MTDDAAPSSPSPSAGPLVGVRVLELGSLIAGPFATRMLAEFGADVIKIESPRVPDPLREWSSSDTPDQELWWRVQARNKHCITLDLKSPRGRELALQLATIADVVVENFRPGTLEKWRLGPESLWEANPKLVIARISGYGQTGSRSHRPGYASVAEAVSGLRYLNGFPDLPPPRSGISLGDSLASLFAVQGILMALYWRDTRGGVGQIVDVSLVESCFALLEGAVPEFSATGHIKSPSGTHLEGIAPSNIFQTLDGRWMVIAANQDTVFRRLATVMGKPDLADDERFATHSARAANQQKIESLVAEWAAKIDSDDLDAILDAAGVPCGPIQSISDIFADPLFWERGMLLRAEAADGDIVVPGIIPKLSKTPGAVRWLGPLKPAAANAEIFGGLLDLSDAEISRLEEDGIA